MRGLYLRMGQSSEHTLNEEFDLWLTDELGKGYAPFRGAPPPAGAPYRAAAQTAITRRPRGRDVRVFMVVLAAAIFLMATTVLAAAAVTGSANPQAWGQYVSDAVSACKTELASGQHGIGQCVRAIARQKGSQESNQHSNAGGSGAGKSHPSPKGRPSGLPGGPPSSKP
jgi:hypothetical protein